jgi:hypothetical protein
MRDGWQQKKTEKIPYGKEGRSATTAHKRITMKRYRTTANPIHVATQTGGALKSAPSTATPSNTPPFKR